MKAQTSFFALKRIALAIALTVTACCTNVFTAQAEGTVPDSTKIEIAGKMTAKHGQTVVVKSINKLTPMPGDRCEMQKHVQKQKEQFSFSAWLVIGEFEVTKVEGDKITLKLLKEKSVIHVNGEKRDHFEDGMQVKLNWMQASG